MPPPRVSLRPLGREVERGRSVWLMSIVVILSSSRWKSAPAGAPFASMNKSQRADQRTAVGRGCGTGPLTLHVTWYSRICNETDRNGDRVARRDCFKSFILPPSRRDVSDAGQPTLGRAPCQDANKNSLHENAQNRSSIHVFNDLALHRRKRSPGLYPPLFHHFLTGNPQSFAQ